MKQKYRIKVHRSDIGTRKYTVQTKLLWFWVDEISYFSLSWAQDYIDYATNKNNLKAEPAEYIYYP